MTNAGINVQDLGQLQEKPAYRTRIEFLVALAVFAAMQLHRAGVT